ncbi:MAG: YdcF family protein [Rickettsiales bacterium]
MFKALSFIGKSLFLSLLIGFVVFVYNIPNDPIKKNEKTDAIVVLTGGMHRVEEGFNKFSDHISRRMFISGVHDRTKLNELIILNEQQVFNMLKNAKNVELGKKAHSTKENAEETYGWIKKNNIKSIRLVTSNYHMPRSIFEFKKILPNIRIVPNPVFSSNFQKNNWWNHLLTVKIMVKEYFKFLYVVAEYYIHSAINEFN